MFLSSITRLWRWVGRLGPLNLVNHTSWVAVDTPTDRPKSVRSRCVIGLFRGVVFVVTLPFWHFCWCRGFCHGTESDLFLFLLRIQKNYKNIFLNFQISTTSQATSFDVSTLYTTIAHRKLKSRLATIIRNLFIHNNWNCTYTFRSRTTLFCKWKNWLKKQAQCIWIWHH